SNGLIEGVEEEGLNLANLYIPGLSRHYIKKLLHAGYNNKQCLKELSIEELAKVLPQKLARWIRVLSGLNLLFFYFLHYILDTRYYILCIQFFLLI
ncbi:unnamed protein product, partial [marine sediment metagenome]